ncbi:MAG: hypothetical protein Q8R76_00455 [Candidatus Omnitrophota bacterium]|nr:hypothetical protein [Candidatus Omnitrophota bacterium]
MIRLVITVLILSMASFSCMTEYDYESSSGTLKIPWGAKEGQLDPDNNLPPSLE